MQCAGEQTGWVLLHHRVTHSSMFPVFVCTHELHVRQWWEDTGFVQSLEVLKKSWHLPSNFPDLEKVWKMEIKSGKMLFFKATASALHFISEIFVVLVKSYSIWPVRLQRIMKWKALFLRFFLRSILITCLITLSLEKEIIVLEWQCGKTLEFWNQKTVRTLKTSWRQGLNQNNGDHCTFLGNCSPTPSLDQHFARSEK